MNFVTKILKSPWFFVPVTTLVLLLTFIYVVVADLGKQFDQTTMTVFSVIVQRAISDQDKAEKYLSRLEDFTEWNKTKAQVEAMPVEAFSAWNRDCSLPLDMRSLDPVKVPGVVRKVVNISTPKVIVFFRGQVPNVSDYLSPENWGELLAPRPKGWRELPISEFEKLTSVDINDSQVLIEAITKRGRKGIRWHGEQCELYSYIIFEGTRHE